MAKNEQQLVVSEAAEQQAVEVVAEAYQSGQMSLTAQFENAGNAIYSSIKDDGTRETKVKIYNALTRNDGKLLDLAKAGSVINVTDLIAHNIQLLDEETGVLTDVTRVVLFTDKGESFSATAKGVVGSIMQIVGIVGRAPWTPALKVKPREVKTRGGFYTLVLELAE